MRPGTIRKVGPSLRHVGQQGGLRFPHQLDRQSPRFPSRYADAAVLRRVGSSGERKPRAWPSRSGWSRSRFAPWLNICSAPASRLNMPKRPPSPRRRERDQAIARGKKVFEVRGCLACHQHADFPKGVATQGPNLSRIGAKLATNPDGRKWLYSWLRDPSRYHARTLMPNLFLDPLTAEGKNDRSGRRRDRISDDTRGRIGSRPESIRVS